MYFYFLYFFISLHFILFLFFPTLYLPVGLTANQTSQPKVTWYFMIEEDNSAITWNHSVLQCGRNILKVVVWTTLLRLLKIEVSLAKWSHVINTFWIGVNEESKERWFSSTESKGILLSIIVSHRTWIWSCYLLIQVKTCSFKLCYKSQISSIKTWCCKYKNNVYNQVLF